jgi:lipopolysaccharide assembly protein A
MQILIWIVRIVVILLIVWFAARNAELVELKGYMDSSVKAPLVLILLAFFGGGLLLGLLASLMTIFQLKREVRKLNRALQHKTHEASTKLPPISDSTSNV